jgi:hypothetical protein
MQGLTLLAVLLGLITSAYVTLTAKWLTWPIRPKKMPITARRRRLVGSGMLLFFLGQSIWYANLLVDRHQTVGPFELGLLMPIVTMVLTVSAAPLLLLGWKMPPQPVKHYGLEGWPPAD